MGCSETIINVDYATGLEFLFNISPDLLILIGKNGCILKVNPAFKKALGYQDEDLLGKNYILFVHPDDVEASNKQYAAVNADDNDTISLFRNRYRCADGEYKWLSWNANLLPDGTMYASARDITETINANKIKQQTLERLRISNERFELATAATNDVIWDWNLRTGKIKWGKNIESSFGYLVDIVEPIASWIDHIHPDDKVRVVTSIQEAISSSCKTFWREEYRYFRANGSVANIIDQAYIMRDDHIAIRMVGAMQDVTELKEKERRIDIQKGQLTDIAQINSHVIRRPVASILGLMQLFDKSSLSQCNLELVEHLENTTRELDEVIKRIVDRTIS